MNDQPFVPTVYSDPDGRRYVNIRPNHGIGVDLLINREMCCVSEGKCLAVVRWKELENGELTPRIYAPSPQQAAAISGSGMTLIRIAQLREQGVLTDFRDSVTVNQTYWISDMRQGKKEGRSYFISTMADNPKRPCFIPGRPYVFQEQTVAPVLTYDELVALVQTPPAGSLVIDTPQVKPLSNYQYYDQGVRLIIEDTTAVQRISDAQTR